MLIVCLFVCLFVVVCLFCFVLFGVGCFCFLLLFLLCCFLFVCLGGGGNVVFVVVLLLLLFILFYFKKNFEGACVCIVLGFVVVVVLVFLPVADAPHVYVRTWTLCCCHSLISTQTFSEGVDSVCRQLRGDEEYPSGVTSSARFRRKVSESDVRSVPSVITDQMLEMSMYG